MLELKKPAKSKPKRIKYTGNYKRQSLIHAQTILLPRHEASGILTAQASSINLDSTNNTQCRIRFYGGNLIIELSSTNAQMSFATNSITDMQLLEDGIHKVIRKVRKTMEK